MVRIIGNMQHRAFFGCRFSFQRLRVARYSAIRERESTPLKQHENIGNVDCCPQITAPAAFKRQEANKSSFLKCMSFVPAPQQANAAGNNNAPNTVNSSTAAAAAETETTDKDLLFKIRTFDVYWVDKEALMYKDGIDKVRRKKSEVCCSCSMGNFGVGGCQTREMLQ